MRQMLALLISAVMLLVTAAPALGGTLTDTDADGTPDMFDMCMENPFSPIPNDLDTDQDGYGNQCDGDLNNDTLVNGLDFSAAGPDNDYLDCFTTNSDPNGIGCDINGDTLTLGNDFSSAGPGNDFLDSFAIGAPGPSGLLCAGTVPCP